MNREDYLKEYDKTLEAALFDILEAYEGSVLALLEDYKSAGDQKEAKEVENDLKIVRGLINKRRAK